MKKAFIVLALLAITALAQNCPPNSVWYKKQMCACIDGYYGDSADNCIKCPNNSWSRSGYEYNTGGKDQRACNTCAEGYYYLGFRLGGLEADCAQCPEGSTEVERDTIGGSPSQCTDCIEGYYLVKYRDISARQGAVCKKCPNNSRPQWKNFAYENESACKYCPDGFYIKQAATEDSGAVCERCPDFSYSSSPQESEGIGACKCFDRNALPLTSKQPTCQCKPGLEGTVSTSMYGKSDCKMACGTNAFNNDDICVCNKGFYGKDASYGKTCTKCPEGTTTSKDLFDDFALRKGSNVSSCDICQENYYMVAAVSQTKSAQCEKCPEFSYLEEGSREGFCKCYDENAEKLNKQNQKCVCKQGYEGTPAKAKGEKGCTLPETKPSTNESTGNKDTSDNGNKGSTSESGNKGTASEGGNKGTSESGNKGTTNEGGNKGSSGSGNNGSSGSGNNGSSGSGNNGSSGSGNNGSAENGNKVPQGNENKESNGSSNKGTSPSESQNNDSSFKSCSAYLSIFGLTMLMNIII
ncbi:hypothetical protein ABPG74_006714 [Tetrahymena malaccensis]